MATAKSQHTKARPLADGAIDKPNGDHKTKARVLVDCALGKPNDVVLLDAVVIEQYAGAVDTTPSAVAYAESLRR